MAKRRVVLTGAAGYISAQLLPVFRERYDLVLLDLTKETREGRVDEIREVDLSDPDVDQYREHFRGADAIVHNAWNSYGEGMSGVLSPQWLPPDPNAPPRPCSYCLSACHGDWVSQAHRLPQRVSIPFLPALYRPQPLALSRSYPQPSSTTRELAPELAPY